MTTLVLEIILTSHVHRDMLVVIILLSVQWIIVQKQLIQRRTRIQNAYHVHLDSHVHKVELNCYVKKDSTVMENRTHVQPGHIIRIKADH